MADHSEMYSKIKKYYENRLWGARAMHAAVERGRITEQEYEEIVGEEYDEDEERDLTATEFVNILIGGEA